MFRTTANEALRNQTQQDLLSLNCDAEWAERLLCKASWVPAGHTKRCLQFPRLIADASKKRSSRFPQLRRQRCAALRSTAPPECPLSRCSNISKAGIHQPTFKNGQDASERTISSRVYAEGKRSTWQSCTLGGMCHGSAARHAKTGKDQKGAVPSIPEGSHAAHWTCFRHGMLGYIAGGNNETPIFSGWL